MCRTPRHSIQRARAHGIAIAAMTRGRTTQLAWCLCIGYFVLVIVLQAMAERALFDHRELDRNLVDYAWQLELIYAADLDLWSGRDFHYARGPLFQLLP